MESVGGPLSAADFIARKEVKRAQALLILALDDWLGEFSFDHIQDAAELLRTAAWRIRSDDAA